MELKTEKRTVGKKSVLGAIRRKGDIPAVLYHGGKENVAVSIEGALFQSHIRAIQKGSLATTKFDVTLGSDRFQAIVKDITYHRTTYDVEHIDLMRVNDDTMVTIHVPVTLKGTEECPGVTQGGQVKVVKRSVKVTLKVGEIPESFVLVVSKLNLGESIRVRDIPMTGHMKARVEGSQVLVVVSK